MHPVEQWFKEMANGDEEAFDFLKAIYFWIHKQDDLIDRDKETMPALSTLTDLDLMRVLSSNVFYQKHRDFFWPILITSGLAYIASEEMKHKDNPIDRITAQVLKSEYGNLMFATAYLTGGMGHAVQMSRKYREYSFDDEKSRSK